MYIMFPIGIMYYFGTNLDSKFSTPDFWPKREETHTIPFEKDEIEAELQRLKARRLAARARRMELDGVTDEAIAQPTSVHSPTDQSDPSPLLHSLQHTEGSTTPQKEASKGWLSWLK